MAAIQIAIQLPAADLDAIDGLVPDRFPSRAAAIRAAIELWLRLDAERAVDDAYRREYGAAPPSRDERALAASAVDAGREALARADLDW